MRRVSQGVIKPLAVVALAAAGAVALSGCSGSATPKPSLPSPAVSPGGGGDQGGGAVPVVNGGAPSAALWAKWGLKPLAVAPPPPAVPPIRLSRSGKVPVISDVPTRQKIVFITIDDGAEKDPRFVQMMRDLRVPFTMFLTRDIIKNDYAYFKPLQALGNSIQNHTLSHPVMPSLSLSAQKAQICGDEQTLRQQYGTTPYLFRPPYGAGAYTANLNAAVQACGPRAIVLWRESMQIKGLQYQDPKKQLHPGDIILAHFRGPSELRGETMVHMFQNLLRRIEEQGFAVARLDDYVAPPSAATG
jgi:peptidoglycan/xylan/chitin deacetylase (PgdA/CDA1 family)